MAHRRQRANAARLPAGGSCCKRHAASTHLSCPGSWPASLHAFSTHPSSSQHPPVVQLFQLGVHLVRDALLLQEAAHRHIMSGCKFPGRANHLHGKRAAGDQLAAAPKGCEACAWERGGVHGWQDEGAERALGGQLTQRPGMHLAVAHPENSHTITALGSNAVVPTCCQTLPSPCRKTPGPEVDTTSPSPASPTASMARIAAGRALPVARNTVTPRSKAARMAATEDGSTRLRLSKSVPSCSRAWWPDSGSAVSAFSH